METILTSFNTLMGCYFEMSSLFIDMLLPGSGPPRRYERVTLQRDIPKRLHAPYLLLHLADAANLAETHMRYRELAKRCHPDVGGGHADFLALQQAYEQIVEHLQTQR